RTVYIGGIHPDATTKDLCDVIRGGLLQRIKYFSDKSIAFVTFVDPQAAANFYDRCYADGFLLRNKRTKVGWGKPTTLAPIIASIVAQNGSRNVYIGGADDAITEDRLRHDFGEFGTIELINLVPEKNIAFVNFTDILASTRAIEVIKTFPFYAPYKINYGKDRCANP
ncbi:hypothetical protein CAUPRSCDRAFT_2802, partial [Caulochytrium protostelioides]